MLQYTLYLLPENNLAISAHLSLLRLPNLLIWSRQGKQQCFSARKNLRLILILFCLLQSLFALQLRAQYFFSSLCRILDVRVTEPWQSWDSSYLKLGKSDDMTLQSKVKLKSSFWFNKTYLIFMIMIMCFYETFQSNKNSYMYAMV